MSNELSTISKVGSSIIDAGSFIANMIHVMTAEDNRHSEEQARIKVATKRDKINAQRDIAISENERKAKEKREEERTKREKIISQKEIIFSNNERAIKETSIKEVSKMFESYLDFVLESHKEELHILFKMNENRKEKYLVSLESAEKRKTELLEIAESKTGQIKMLYLDEVKEIEKTIRHLQEKDKEEDSVFATKLIELKNAQKTEIANQREKTFDTIAYNGGIQ